MYHLSAPCRHGFDRGDQSGVLGGVGEGVAEVTSADEPSEVVLRLQFLKPFKSDNTVTYTLAPDGDGTRVSWRMDGPLNLFMRVFTLVKPMDSMVGKDFEEGLANLKREAEALT